MCIPDYLRVKDLQKITGKSESQAKRDMKAIKTKKGYSRKVLVTVSDAANFFGLTTQEVESKLA